MDTNKLHQPCFFNWFHKSMSSEYAHENVDLIMPYPVFNLNTLFRTVNFLKTHLVNHSVNN